MKAFQWLQPAGQTRVFLSQPWETRMWSPPARPGPHQHGLLPTSHPGVAQPPPHSPGALVPSKATAYHGFQAADLILRPIEQLFPVPLLLEQQLGPSAREATLSALAALQGRASSPTMLAPRQCPLLFPAVPQQLPGQGPLPLQLLCDPLLVLPQLVPLLLQLLGKHQGCSPVSGSFHQAASPGTVRKGRAILSNGGLCHPEDM